MDSLLISRIESVLDTLYDYDYIDLDKFYNDKDNMLLIELFENREQDSDKKLYDAINDFIKFETNYNSCIGDF